MTWIDSHAHFDSFVASGEVDAVLQRATEAGVERVIAMGGSDAANRTAISLAERDDRVSAVVGYDRDQAGKAFDEVAYAQLLNHPQIVGVGECGLDYHYTPESAMEQQALFEQMLHHAADARLPVVIHSRDADADTLRWLRAQADRWQGGEQSIGVLHCFTGSATFAKTLLDLGLLISFSGIITFKNAEALRDVARMVPDDRLLIETDAPYLAPVPYRGKTNEPAYVPHVAETLATIRNTPLEDIARMTTENALRLFASRTQSPGSSARVETRQR